MYMNSFPPSNQETIDLAERFLRVMEISFKKLAEHRKFPQSHSVFKSLNINQIRAMHLLYHESGMLQKDLAEKLEVTPAAISTTVGQMEQLGLVERRSDSGDLRQKRLYLSDYGHTLIQENQAMRRNSVADLLGVLPLSEQQMIVELLERAVSLSSVKTSPESVEGAD